MLKKDVISFFKTRTAVARVLGISKPSVSDWDEVIPELRARQLHEITRGRLKFRPELYDRGRSAA